MLRADSGMVSAYRPAVKVKPPKLLAPIVRAAEKFVARFSSKETTQMGAPGAAAPSTYQQSLWSLRFERRAYIEDCRLIDMEEPRLHKSLLLHCAEAFRGGVTIRVEGSSAMATQAQSIANEIVALVPPSLLTGWGRKLMLEGDLFVQAVVAGDTVVAAKSMPAASMERLSDDADEFIDPMRAFEQVDTMTWQTVAPFPAALMCQVRWNHLDGNRYGEPEFLSARRPWRILKLLEEGNAVGRMTRANSRILWTFGDPKLGTSGSEADINTFKNQNGMVDGQLEIFDPVNIARNYFGANVDVKQVGGDPQQDEIKDILHMQNVLAACAPMPPVLFGLDAESVNRDVVEDLMNGWLKETRRLNESIEEAIRFLIDLGLMLQGISPKLVTYTCVWQQSTIEKPSDIIDSTRSMREGKLISRRTAVARVAPHAGVQDVDAEIQELDKEAESVAQEEQERLEVEKSLITQSKAKKDALLLNGRRN